MKTSVCLAVALLLTGSAMAQTYPSRPIRMVVPYAVGGSTDILARIVATGMSQSLGQSVVVENLGGGGATIGTQKVVKSTPDGYTLTFGNMGSMSANASLYPKLDFSPTRDLAPVGLVATIPMVMSVSTQSGIQDLPGLMRQLRATEKKVNVGSSGPGSTGHLAAASFLSLTRTNAEIISYRGAGPAMTDLMAGTIDVLIDQTVTMLPMHKGGKIKAIAVSADKRIATMPDVPTFAEGGVPEFKLAVWNAIAAPAGTPKPVIDKLAQALRETLERPDIRKRLAEYAADIPSATQQGPAAFAQLLSTDTERFARLVKETGIRVE